MVLAFLALFSLIAGLRRNELALTLPGAIFLGVLVYCFTAGLFLALIHRKGAYTLSVRIVPPELSPGRRAAVFCFRGDDSGGAPANHKGGSGGKRKFFRLPGLLIRYQLVMATRDGRSIKHVFDPDYLQDNLSSFTAAERGAYYGDYDCFYILDILGFFRVTYRLPIEEGPRLLVLPGPAVEPAPLSLHAGGQEQRIEPRFKRTDNYIDHRPYVPGDDPRKINWKLYSHAGDLFIREGEPEPPPHSRLVILVDTQTDPGLYSPEAGRRAVDMLCENALAIALEYTGRGMDIHIGWNIGPQPRMRGGINGGPRGGTPGELALLLAYPAALPLTAPEDLPPVPEDRGLLILALPRGSGNSNALDRFLKKQGNKTPDLLFLYTGDSGGISSPGELDRAAESNVVYYNKRGGVHARHIRL
jgi:hypothetical protein